MDETRLFKQMGFMLEIDKLKNVYRQSYITGERRRENDAEHTWHLAMMAFILAEHANAPDLDLHKVFRMLLIHDIVEIDAGDTYAYDAKGHEDKEEREDKAARRIFGLLPGDQRDECYALWQEFEARQTNEAKFASAVDRLQPMLLNLHTDGTAWLKHGIRTEQVMNRNRQIADGSEALWAFAQEIIEEAVQRGYLK